MQLEAGKKYTDRRGRVYGPMVKVDTLFSEDGDEFGNWFGNGKSFQRSETTTDLVAEYVEPVKAAEPEYRMLTEGELIQEGDEYRAWGNRWEKAPGIGKKWTSKIYVSHRRLVKPEETKAAEPEPVESPDDLVIQDRVPAREGIDFGWNVSLKDWGSYKPCEMWKWNINDNYAGRMHGSVGNIGRLAVFCRRKDLPPVPPQTRTVVLKEWLCWDDDGPVVLLWQDVDPTTDGIEYNNFQHAVETGNTRTVEIPVT